MEEFWISLNESQPEPFRWCRLKRNDEWVSTGRANNNGVFSLFRAKGLAEENKQPTHYFYIAKHC